MDPNSPFGPPPKEDPMLYLKAIERKRALEKGYPVAGGAHGESRFTQPPQTNALLDLLSRFLRPGGQTAPASPKFNQEGVEDEVIQK